MKAVSHVVFLPSQHYARREHGWRSWYFVATVAACCPFLLGTCSWWLWSSDSSIIGGSSSSSNHSLSLRTNVNPDSVSTIPVEDPCQGKEQLMKIVHLAGIDISNDSTRRIICSMMPLWSEVASLYGDKPRIIGLERCQQYRDMLTEANQTSSVPIYSMPRVAGLHNSGTNALADTFFDNLVRNPTIRSENPRVYNIPWRKHTPFEYRFNVTARFYDWHENKSHVLPVVVIRDPYKWMASMCKINYNVHWMHATKHCPNLVWYPSGLVDAPLHPVNVSLELKEPTLKTSVKWESLAHMWSDWNLQYLNADIPRLIVRYEDTIYHSEEVFRAISECSGVPLQHDTFRPFALKANSYTNASNDLISALAKNGVHKDRFSRMIAEDIEYAKEHLDPQLMQLFHYLNPDSIPPDSYAALDLSDRKLK